MVQNTYHGGDEPGSILIDFVLDKSGPMDRIRDKIRARTQSR